MFLDHNFLHMFGNWGNVLICEFFINVVYDYSTDGSKNVRYAYITQENCTVMWIAQQSAAGTTTCPSGTGDGEIPVIEPGLMDPCKTTAAEIGAAFPNASKAAKDSLESIINEYAEDFGIDSKEKLQHFLGQAAHETGGFTALTNSEGLYYTTTERLVEVWPSRFSVTDTINKANPKHYLKNAKKLANFVYAEKNGNGDEVSGDGYKYRGRGIFQLTGKSNYQAFTDFYQDEFDSTDDFVTDPDKIGTEDRLSVISALWYYKAKVLDKITVDNNTSVSDVTKKINPAEEGLDDRKSKTEAAQNNINDCEG